MDIEITAMCWVLGKQEAHETAQLNEHQLLEVLRGAAPPVFKTPPAEQVHWELREIRIGG